LPVPEIALLFAIEML